MAGVIYSSRSNGAQPAAGNMFELDAIAAAFIGGAAVAGGVGTVVGAMVGGLIMAVMSNGMQLMGIDQSVQSVVKGSCCCWPWRSTSTTSGAAACRAGGVEVDPDGQRSGGHRPSERRVPLVAQLVRPGGGVVVGQRHGGAASATDRPTRTRTRGSARCCARSRPGRRARR